MAVAYTLLFLVFFSGRDGRYLDFVAVQAVRYPLFYFFAVFQLTNLLPHSHLLLNLSISFVSTVCPILQLHQQQETLSFQGTL